MTRLTALIALTLTAAVSWTLHLTGFMTEAAEYTLQAATEQTSSPTTFEPAPMLPEEERDAVVEWFHEPTAEERHAAAHAWDDERDVEIESDPYLFSNHPNWDNPFAGNPVMNVNMLAGHVEWVHYDSIEHWTHKDAWVACAAGTPLPAADQTTPIGSCHWVANHDGDMTAPPGWTP